MGLGLLLWCNSILDTFPPIPVTLIPILLLLLLV